MKKRVLSMFMALALCLTLLPTAALADELGPVDGTSTVETAGADEEAEAKAKAGAEAVATVQAMIDALPDALTEENAGDGSAMLGKIDAAMAALGDEERAALDLTQYQAVIAALAALAAAQGEIALYADENNKPRGDGTEAHPYQITSTDELEWFRDTVNEGNAEICAELMNDLHFNDETGWTWTPIGKDAGKAYTGTFNGNGYKIKMDYAVAPDGMTAGWGLFGSIGNDGKVQDLDIYLTNFGRKGKVFSISKSGMLAAYNSGTIERCTAMSGKINVSNGVGLLVYQNNGTIQDCWTKHGTVVGGGNLIGGVAYTNNGHIKNCFFNGSYNSDYLNNHTIAFEKGKSGSIENCYFISGRKHTDNTVGVTGVEQADANSGKLTVKLNNNGNEKGSKVDPWRIDGGSTNRYPSLKKTDYRVRYNSTTDGYEKGDPPHMHGNVEFTKVTALSDITADGNYYISGEIALDSTWEVDKKILLCLDGQTITAASDVAPAIKISSGGSLTLVDGSKSGGGKITGGATGVMLDGGAFTMQGGEISGNTVGVHVKSGDLTLGGKAKITDNPAADAGVKQNILLAQGSEISFDSLDPSAKFGISVEGQKDLSDPVAVTDATGGQYFGQLVADGFKDNGVGFELYLSDDGKTVMLGKQSAHTHCICGDSSKNVNGHTHGADITFQPWRETDKLPTSGNYYLTRNVTLTKNATLQNANVCLNGYTVTLSNVGRINPSGTTQLTDCSVNGKLESYPGKANGGVAISNGNTFCLYGGTLNGVKVEIGQTGGGTFNMYGGKITGNTQGTVVGQSKTSKNTTITINMYGGEISGNHISENQGGGVFVGSGNQFNMYGGTIQNNSAVDGGGVYIAPKGNAYQAGTMTIHGDAVIQGNKAGSVLNNVSLPSGKTITISGKLGKNANIGVTTRANLSQGNVNIATATDAGWVAAKNFTSDNSAYHVGLAKDGKTVQLQVHSHQWEYSVSQDGTTITATCTAGNCDLADSNGGSVRIVQPTGLIYDGAEKTATVNISQDWQGEAVDASTIVYTKEGDDTFIGKPKDAGTYTASITVGGVTASVKYTIAQAELTIDSVTVTSKTYNGSADAEITNVTFTGLKNSEALTKGKDYEVSGTFNSANVNEANKVTGTVTLKDTSKVKNYKLPITTYDVSATIAQAATPAAPTGLTGVKDQLLSTVSLAAHPGWSWADGTVSMSTAGSQDFNANYHDSNGNYADGTNVPVSVNVVNKTDTGVTITGLPQTVTYVDAFTLEAAQTGDTGTSGKWSWDFDGDYFQEKSTGGHQETLTLQAIKAGTPSKDITATYESGTHKGSATVNAVVEKKEVTVTAGSYKVSKTYDGTTNAGTATGELNVTGILSADSGVTVKVTPVAYTSANVGGQTSMNVSIALDGTGKDNYKIKNGATTVSVPCEVTKAMLTVEGTGTASGTYGDKLSRLTVSGLTAKRNGTVVPGTWSLTGNTVPNVGDNGTYTATFTPESGVDNYDALTKDGVTLNITKAAYGNQSVSGSAKYGTTGSVDLSRYLAAGGSFGTITTADSEKVLSGDPVMEGNSLKFTFVNDASKANKMATITVPVTGATNYESYTITVTVTVNDKTTPVVTAPTAKTRLVYNGADQVLIDAGSATGGTLQYSLASGSGYSTELPKVKNAGTYTVYYKVIGNDGYADVPENSVSVSVAKRAISVKADNKSMTANGTLPTFTVTYGNFASGDSEATVIETKATAFCTADGTSTGSFPITVSGTTALKSGMDTNYEVGTPESGTLTVNPRSSGGGGGGGGASVPTFTVTAPAKTDNGSVSVSPKNAAAGSTVTVTVTPDKGYTIETLTVLDKDGKELKFTEKNGKYTFTMPAGKVEVKVTFMEDNSMLNFFVDVKADNYFYDAVKWAAEKGITSGTDDTHFSPNAACTRAQIVTFLWRAAGSPEPKGTGSFADVSADSYYTKAVAWAVENGITGGTGDGKFSPNATCTREQAVAFLYRASGSPAVSGGSAFNDVAANAYYADAVAWAEKNEITGGIGGGLFGSGNDCTRAQIVTFLYRTYQGK